MARVKIVIKTNKTLNDGSFPLNIRVSHLNQPTHYIRINGLSEKNRSGARCFLNIRNKIEAVRETQIV